MDALFAIQPVGAWYQFIIAAAAPSWRVIVMLSVKYIAALTRPDFR